jgi:hypothetical protein
LSARRRTRRARAIPRPRASLPRRAGRMRASRCHWPRRRARLWCRRGQREAGARGAQQGDDQGLQASRTHLHQLHLLAAPQVDVVQPEVEHLARHGRAQAGACGERGRAGKREGGGGGRGDWVPAEVSTGPLRLDRERFHGVVPRQPVLLGREGRAWGRCLCCCCCCCCCCCFALCGVRDALGASRALLLRGLVPPSPFASVWVIKARPLAHPSPTPTKPNSLPRAPSHTRPHKLTHKPQTHADDRKSAAARVFSSHPPPSSPSSNRASPLLSACSLAPAATWSAAQSSCPSAPTASSRAATSQVRARFSCTPPPPARFFRSPCAPSSPSLPLTPLHAHSHTHHTASLYAAAAAKMSGIEKIKVANPVVDLDGDEMTR